MGKVPEHLFMQSPSDIIIPSIVIYELQVGIAKSENPNKRRKQLATLLEQVEVGNFSAKEAKISALIRATLEQQGQPIGPLDTLIAGYAKANNAILVTHNVKEFERVEGLIIEDWF